MLPVLADFVRFSMVMKWIEDDYLLLWAVEDCQLREGGTKAFGTSNEDSGECRRTSCVKEQEGLRRQLEATCEAGQISPLPPPPGL